MKAYVFFNRRMFKDSEMTLEAHFGTDWEPDFNDYDLEWVVDEVAGGTPEELASEAFALLNRDNRPNPTRSMSVGDLVVVTNPPAEDVFLLCQVVGWRRVVPVLT